MTQSQESASTPPHVVFGPEAPGWGSWNWIGADGMSAMKGPFLTGSFAAWDEPGGHAAVVVKHSPPQEWAERVSRHSTLIFAPVDFYGSAADIDADAPMLRRCDRIVIHCERLRKYFEPYATVEYLDHHIKFAAPVRKAFHSEGDLLWVGVRSNLDPLIDWVNANSLPYPLDVMTNLKDPSTIPSPGELGFRPKARVRIHDWSPARQVEMTTRARGVIDIKGMDFRSRHKPPAKGIDVIASGVPLAMNQDSSTVEHLARMGFEIVDPLDTERWFSHEYWEETQRFGLALRELLSSERVARRFRRIIENSIKEHAL